MKFPSLKTLASETENTVQRFPFEFLFAVIGTAAAILHSEADYQSYSNKNWLIRIILSANLGLLLSLATTLYTESKETLSSLKLTYKAIAFFIAISFIFILDPHERPFDYYRFFLLSLSFHLLVSFSAYTPKEHIQGFWQFNKTLFLRFLSSVLYSGVLFIGLAAAIAAANYLFNLKIDWHTYTNLWYIIAGIFNTLFFLTGIPPDTKALENDLSYPKSLKIFTQYVLIPLASIYLLILLAYEIKILIQWNLPKGVVSNLILGYAVYGILSILLVYPIKEQEDNKWIKSYARSFYFLMLPLLVLLFLAMGKRISDYGVTEDRYFLLLLGCWLLFITLYFLVSKKQNIKLIPVSLCVLTLLSIYGPQSAFSVSTYSQRNILISIFKKYNAFKDGKLVPVPTQINKTDANNAVEKLRYLVEKKGLLEMQPYISKDLSFVKDSLNVDKTTLRYSNVFEEAQWLKNHLGLSRFNGSRYQDIPEPLVNYTFNTGYNNIVDIAGYDYALPKTQSHSYNTKAQIKGMLIEESSNEKSSMQYVLSINREKVIFNMKGFTDSLTLPRTKLNGYKKSSSKIGYVLPDSLASITQKSKSYIITLKVNSVGFSTDSTGKNLEIYFINALYLIKKK